MARTIRSIIAKALWGKDLDALLEEYNTLVDEVEELKANAATLNAKLDADAGVTDTDYASTLDPSATDAKKFQV